ncbi:MAG: acyl-CoA dehydrogenase family protein [Desulfomonile sp.]|nr:acyl-CoA dehydrogenase family protein [Desulfomonile sp.]
MDFRFTPEEQAYKSEFMTWLEKNLPLDWDTSTYRVYHSMEEWAQAHRDFQRRLYEAGYEGLHYPKEYGGQGLTLMHQLIVAESIAATCIELKLPGVISFGMAAPTIFLCGTEEQKRRFLPKTFDGTYIWCQGFSEPNAGSDVVNVSTRAVKDNGHYLVNGQKIWTSFANIADWCILLVRTDPAALKHKGLSYLLLDMKSPGVEVRPIRQMTGDSDFNEVFLEDVRVPEDMLVGEEGQGWRIAITTLMFERAMGDTISAAWFLRNVHSMIDMARHTKRSGRPVIQNPVFRQQLAQAYIDVMMLKCHGYRSLSQLLKGGIPGPEGSIGKLLWSEANQRICRTALSMEGPFSQIMGGSPWSVQDGMWQYLFLRSKGNTIEGGTSEIQLNIIGERVLGLPKDITRVARIEGS